MHRMVALLTVSMSFAVTASLAADDVPAADEGPFTIVVMDPLSIELACECVEGYAQRNYTKFGEFLSQFIGRDVKVVFSSSLETALDGDAGGHCDLVIGKYSVVRFDAGLREIDLEVVAQLTGRDGSVMQTGLFVVRSDDPAQTIEDIADYQILFGPEECDEKSAAPMALLTEHGIDIPDPVETVPTCGAGATRLIELAPGAHAAAVISSYAVPLLEGCGTVKKGDLRVIAQTGEVPFISAFVPADMDAELREAVVAGLMEVQYDLQMMVALESQSGFVPPAEELLEDAEAVADAETRADAEKN
jgi:ABC-type phosphate/phosphonate transport system substrate-binding protein